MNPKHAPMKMALLLLYISGYMAEPESLAMAYVRKATGRHTWAQQPEGIL